MNKEYRAKLTKAKGLDRSLWVEYAESLDAAEDAYRRWYTERQDAIAANGFGDTGEVVLHIKEARNANGRKSWKAVRSVVLRDATGEMQTASTLSGCKRG